MADAAVTILDSSGTARAMDAQTVGADFQQTITVGDGVNAGRVAAVDADGSLHVQTNLATVATKTNVAATVASKTVLAANPDRRGALIYNDSTSVMFLSYGSTASSATSFSVRIAAATLFVMETPLWTGVMTGAWVTANGNARVTDLSSV